MLTLAASVDPLATVSRYAGPPLRSLGAAAAKYAPSLLGGLVVLVLLYIVARVIRSVLTRLLSASKLDDAIKKSRFQKILESVSPGLTASRACAELVYIAILLLGVSSATESWGMPAVQQTLSKMLGYFPRVISALVVFAVGGYLAGIARRAVGGALRAARSSAAGALESATEGALLVIIGLIAIDILGVNISFLSANLTLAMGALLLALTFLFGWSMRRPAEELMANYYLRRLVSVGDHISLAGVEGTVTQFAPLGLLLQDGEGQEVFLPARHVLNGLRRTKRASVSGDGDG